MSWDKVHDEIYFMVSHGIMKSDKVMHLYNNRKTLNRKIAYGLATRDEVLKQIKVELIILDKCQLKIVQKIKGKNAGYINNKILTIFTSHINDMYNRLFYRFPVEKTSLSEYVEFCAINKLFVTRRNNMLDILMSKYHSDPQVYIIAATYEFDDRNDIEMARKYFSEGLKYHKNCKILCVEEFWIEVQHLEKTHGASLPIAIRKYRNLINLFKTDMEFHFILLDKAIKFRTVGELQSNVVRDMVKKYRLSELMWQKLAKINFDGLIYYHDIEKLHNDKNSISGIRSCIKTYEDGLKENLSLDSKHNLWNFYIDHVIEIRKSYHMKKETIRNFMNETMERVFQEAHDNGALRTEEHYTYWVKNTNKKKLTALNAAFEVLNESVELWIQLLSFHIDWNHLEKATNTFNKGVQKLKNKSLPLWEMMIPYLQNTSSQLLKKLYQDGASSPYREISSVIRTQYLEWCLHNKGIIASRKLFSELKDMEPPNKELYSAMIKCEKTRCSITTKLGFTRKLYNDMCNKFGKHDIEVWLDCIRFEYTLGNRELVQNIYSSSLGLLDSSLTNDMSAEFEKLKEEFKVEGPKDKDVIVFEDIDAIVIEDDDVIVIKDDDPIVIEDDDK